ncbi:TPA: hypothetical protein ACF1UY_001765 [Enterococcus hirae]
MDKKDRNKIIKRINKNYDKLNNSFNKNTTNIINEIKKLKLIIEPPKFFSLKGLWYLTKKFLIFLLFSLPFSTQIENMINNKNYMLDYNLSNYSLKIPETNYDFSLLPDKANTYQHCFYLNANCYIYEGNLNHLFLIYSKDENNKFSESDFTEIKLKNKTTIWNKIGYMISSMKILNPILPFLKNTYNQKLELNCKINYGSSTRKKTKNFYLLTIDKQNNISLNILQITTTAKIFAVDPTDTGAKVGINLNIDEPKFKLIKTTDLLSGKYSSQELSNIKSDLAEITNIFNQYIVIKE